MSGQNKDISIDGPGSPISLRKFIELDTFPKDGKIQVLIDSTGEGIAKDDTETMYITPDECKKQAIYFLDEFFDRYQRFPLYAAPIIHYLYFDASYRFKTRKDFLDHVNNDPENEDYKKIFNKFKYGKDNPEFLQILGLIQLFAGTLLAAKNENKQIRLYIEHPETHIHPQRERLLMTVFYKISKEYQ